MDDDPMIAALASGLKPVRPVMRPLPATAIWLMATSAILTGGALASHVRPDLGIALAGTETLARACLSVATACLAAFAAFQLAIPGRGIRWFLPAVLGALAWLVLTGIGCRREFAMLGGFAALHERDPSCLTFIAGFGLPILLLTLTMARHGLWSRPVPVALLAGLAASAGADAGVVVVDHPHAALATLIFHGGAAMVLAAIAVVAGPWWMRMTGRWLRPRSL